MKTFKVKIRVSNAGSTQTTTVNADNYQNAKHMAEMLYGKSNVIMVW